MTELKTLKEINLCSCTGHCTCDTDITKNRLREEAIKWIKVHCEDDWDCHCGSNPLHSWNKHTNTEIKREGYGNDEKDFCPAWQFIKFFNILEEELR